MSAGDPVQIFIEEAAELLTQLEDALLRLEGAPHDRDLVDTVFRALHTIKGSGAMFGFDAVAAFTHHLENAFDLVRNGRIVLTPALIGVALASKDLIRTMMERPSEVDPRAADALLAAVAEHVGEDRSGAVPSVAGAPADAGGGRPATWRIRFRLARDAMVMGTNPLLLLDELRALGTCSVAVRTDGIPPLAEMDPTGCYLAWDVTLTTGKPESAIQEVFMFVIDDMELRIEEQTGADPARSSTGPATGPATGAATGAAAPAAATTEPAGAVAANSIRVSAERLDSLMDQVGELVIAQARLKQLADAGNDPSVRAIAEEIERLSNGLRDTTMGIRMVPIGSLFGRFRRLVRDLSQDLGKGVRLTMSGEETELDKTVIERLNDPLVHIIRNSLDHGLEREEARVAAGKSPDGHIHLSAGHSGAQVLITIRDDGRGLDRARIRAKAEERGLITEATQLTDHELIHLIFHPGFSTAAEITNLSGRGVGMDVVKRTIEALRGTIDITSEPGEGTTITLRLPLTLAIIDGLLVRVGEGRYVIPLSAVDECVELSAESDLRHSGRNFLGIRGDLVPFIRLREVFASRQPAAPYQKVVVVSTEERRVGLVVDQVIGDHQTVIKSLSKLHADVESFSGATILGDGTVALILDIPHLIEAGQVLEHGRRAS
ncbi:MAG TPA: chemotaxis protein CheA [Azospirillum sp.]|nr:chemotaxis protein CheA [Azospirillum sp.]